MILQDEEPAFTLTAVTELSSDMDSSRHMTPFLIVPSDCGNELTSNGNNPYQQHHRFTMDTNRILQRPRVLTPLMLLALCYFVVGGGPNGSETIITSAGPLIGLLALVLFLVLVYFPMAYIVTELISILPDAGGHAYWIARAFGPAIGFQTGYWSWVSNCINGAMYASLAITTAFGCNTSDSARMTFLEFVGKALFVSVLALPAFCNLRMLGLAALALMAVVMTSYLSISVWGALQVNDWSTLGEIRHSFHNNTIGQKEHGVFTTEGDIEIDFGNLLSFLFWNFCGFHNISVLVTAVYNPAQTYRRVMLLSFVLLPLTYLVPFTSFIGVNAPPWMMWMRGSFSRVAESFGGDITYIWVIISCTLTTSALYICAILCSAYLACGMAEKGFAPASLGVYPTSGSPHGAIFCSVAVILVVITLDFEDMLLISNALGGLEGIMIILSAVRLRFTMGDCARSTKLCGDLPVLFMILPLLIPFTVMLCVIAWAFHTLISGVLTAVLLLIGLIYGHQETFTNFYKLHDAHRSSRSSEPSVPDLINEQV